MFTGLVSAIGEVERADLNDEGLELVIRSPFTDLQSGESIAVDGACLTVIGHAPKSFRVHIIRTSLDRTAFAG
ncbi:MAG: riboflavin synthase, partial [Gemmatimonadota bacterium]